MKRLRAILAFEDSRKVAFGLYLFIFSSAFLAFGKLTGGEWLTTVSFSSVLIGGGTVADAWMKIKNGLTTT